jgi:putative transposase
LNPGVASYLRRMWPKLLKEMSGVEIVEQNIQVDHIHTVMIIPPKYAVSDVIGRLKGRSASLLRKQFQWLERVYWKENIVWSPGYFVSTVGVDEEQILRYVKYQQDQDSGQAKLDL